MFVSPTTNGANTISNPYPAPNFYIISASQPSVTVMSPKGGDHLEMVAGSNYTITWQAKDVQSFKVYDCFSAGDTGQTQGCTLLTGSNPYLIDSASGKYGYNWSINAQYKVNTIKVVDADHPDVSGSSGEWYWWPQAPQPSITITSPQAGTSTTWTNGQTYNITWTSTGLDSVFILLDNGSAGYINVGNVTASSGLYSFTVPSTAKGTYSVTMKKGQNDGTAFTSGGTVVIPGTSSSSADKSAQIASIQAAIKLLSGQLAEAQR